MEQYFISLMGGIALGLSGLLLLALKGKVAGISGILNSIINDFTHERWRLWFILGMISAGGVALLVYDYDFNYGHLDWHKAVAAGLLVGVGTALANGCTSGHGICGLGRLSLRSLVATVTFMMVAAIVVNGMGL
ncbi:YeeE/YedE family protein [Paraferrimonas sp. SM1919]|uniref:YeeE/YedE family protein n=1 Tax=Paraferrimonas sp. SM1919 TaxID=2662263 RepID=UPI0013D894A9|nr:YeeE/YedE family protein [Paraferrimonas sp. SM1919]